MSDMVSEQPGAGWYPDPSAEAPYRWWDGDRWSLRTTRDPEHAEIPELAFAAPLPSGRALRRDESAVGRAAEPSSAAGGVVVADPATPEFIPLNPLVSRHAPQRPTAQGFVAPETWIENSPAAADHAVYGTGIPFTSAFQRPDEPAPVNSFANLGAGFAVIGLLYQVVIAVWGVASATSYSGLAVAAALLAGIVLGVLGMVRAGRFTPRGARPQRAPGLLVILVCIVALGAQVAVAVGMLVPTGIHDVHLPFGYGLGG